MISQPSTCWSEDQRSQLTPDAARPRLTVLFDGQCGLCSRTVQFFIRNERSATFMFTPIQSDAGLVLAKAADLDPADPSSFAVFDEARQPKLKSNGAIYALSFCRAPWPAVAALCRVLPSRLCDSVYDFVAKRRLKFFGTTDVCAVAPEALKQRLVTSSS